jgi:peptide/nickel transport system substrate-binding protein
MILIGIISNPQLAFLRLARAKQETTLRLGITQFPDTFNPFTAVLSSSFVVFSMVYDMGIQVEGPKNDPVPDLAESWEVSPDGLTWTLHFVHNATWHDGVPFTSADYKFTLDYATDYPNFNATNQISSIFNYVSTIIKTDTPDPYTAVVHMSKPLADFGQPFFFILPKHIWENVTQKVATTTFKNLPLIGTGPFKYLDSKLNECVKLDANYQYFRGAPNIDHLILKFYADPDTMVEALVRGEVDVISPPFGSVSKLQSEKNIQVTIWPSRSISEMGFNVWSDPSSKGNPALKDYRFRQALAHAINKTEIVSLAYHGLAQAGDSVLSPSMTLYYWQPTPQERLEFNLTKANQMLDQLGYTKWDATHTYRIDPTTKNPFSLTTYVSSGATELISAGTLIVNWCKQIGIGLQLRVVDSAQMTTTNLAGGMDTYLWGWGWDPDPDFALSSFTTSAIGLWSDSFYSNATFDAMYQQQHTATDPQARQKMIIDMQKFLYYYGPYIVLEYALNVEAHRTDSFTGWIDPTQYPGWDPYWWKYAGDLTPITTAPTTPQATAGNEIYIATIAVIVIVLAVGGLVVYRKRKIAAEEEE